MLRERNRELGLLLMVLALVLILSLRWWTSPVLRRITGRSGITQVEFLSIPVFFVPLVIGVVLFLWEPEPQ